MTAIKMFILLNGFMCNTSRQPLASPNSRKREANRKIEKDPAVWVAASLPKRFPSIVNGTNVVTQVGVA